MKSLKLVPVVMLAACGSSQEAAPRESRDARWNDGVTVLAADVAADVDVRADRLIFPAKTHPAILAAKPGDVLVGDAGGPANAWGFLRKVQSVAQDGDSTVALTQAATLTDVLKDGSLSAKVRGPGVPIVDASGKKLLDVSGKTDVNGKTLGYAAHVTVTKGTLAFSPEWDFDADLSGGLKTLRVAATGELDADLELDVGLSIDGDATGDDIAKLMAMDVLKAPSAVIADYPVDLGHVAIGPLSMPVHAEFKATLACDVAYGGAVDVAIGGKASASITAGFEYANGGMSPVYGHSETLEAIAPSGATNASVHARCSVRPELDLRFFDVAAGEVWAEAYVQLGADATCDATTGTLAGDARAGVLAAAHAKVDVFGLVQWEKACTLFDVESPAMRVSQTFALTGNDACAVKLAALPVADANPSACFGGESRSGEDDAGRDAGACHDTCALGGPVGANCTSDTQEGACIASVCANDSYCCEFNWSASCVAHVTNGDYACVKRSCP